MDRDSRYFATVRLATSISLAFKSPTILLSLSGFWGFSSSVIFLIRALIAVLDVSSPLSEASFDEKSLQFKDRWVWPNIFYWLLSKLLIHAIPLGPQFRIVSGGSSPPLPRRRRIVEPPQSSGLP